MTVGIEREIGVGKYKRTFFTPLKPGKEVVLDTSYYPIDPARPTAFDEFHRKRKVVTLAGPESVYVDTSLGRRVLVGEKINNAELKINTWLGKALRSRVVNR